MAFNKPFLLWDANTIAVGVGYGGGMGASRGRNSVHDATAPVLSERPSGHPKGGGGGGGCASVEDGIYKAHAGTGGAVDMTTLKCSNLSPLTLGATYNGVRYHGGYGGTGAVAPETYTSTYCTSPGEGGGFNNGGGGAGGGALIQEMAYANHGGGGGGAITQVGGSWNYTRAIAFAGGGGGGGALNGAGGGGGGGLAGGGGGGGAGGAMAKGGVLSTSGEGGSGGLACPGCAGSNGSRNVGGNGGKGGWHRMELKAHDGGHVSDAWIDGILPNDRCHGGAGGVAGQDGAVRISYLDYNKGGGGGGGAGALALAHENVVPGETLFVIVGRGGKGGTAGKIDENGKVVANTSGGDSNRYTTTGVRGEGLSKILRSDSTKIFSTCDTDNYNCGPMAGSPDGGTNYASPFYGKPGVIGAKPIFTRLEGVEVKGFSTSWGKPAGNVAIDYAGTTLGVGLIGGDGGISKTPFTPECVGNTGGTASSPKGGTASQGYGCGGGGGYGLSDGGSGSGGYARISWNKYWDTVTSAYKYADIGAGGGGASGNIMSIDNISAKSGEKIKIRIGKGGTGGSVNNNNPINAKRGGDTIFAYNDNNRKLLAKGGNPGSFPSVSQDGQTIINGAGGTVPNNTSELCTYKGSSYSSNPKYCTLSRAGNPANNNTGGEGSKITTLPTLLNGVSINFNSTAGIGGTTGDNSYGKPASGYGAGGGGAGILDVGTPTLSTYNPNTGGNGSNGKIIIEWWE